MTTLWEDVRYSVRSLRKRPGFSSIVILTLAIGICANTTIFSVVNAVLLRALPYPNPERLLVLSQQSVEGEMAVSFPDYLDWRDSSSVAPPACECNHIQILQIELRNAQTLRNNFMRKIEDLRKYGNDSSQVEFKRFAGAEARAGVENVPGYRGPSEVDYVPHGQNVSESRLDEFPAAELCKMEASAAEQLDAAVNASACSGIGEALRAHEAVHRSRCLSKGYRPYLAMHGADRAQEEVEAYEAQISKLKQELDNAIKMCKFNLRFESEMERTQGATREFARVRASLNLEAASVKDNVLELGPAETTLEYLEYTWTDKAAPKCTHTGRGSGGRFRVTSAQLMLKPAEAPPKLTLENVSLVADPGKTNEVHTVSCEGLTMSFPGTYWSAAFGHLHGGSTGFNASDWTVGSGEQAQARKVFEIMKECNKATCKERTEMVLQRRTQATAITFR